MSGRASCSGDSNGEELWIDRLHSGSEGRAAEARQSAPVQPHSPVGPRDESLGPPEREFIESRDGFYMASVSETGWPYLQYRGGPKGFLRVIDDPTLGFADFRGNRQYVSVGNLKHEPRVALFLIDYPSQSRLKIFGRAEILEGTDAEDTLSRLVVPGYFARVERAILIHLEAFDWNCQQHITPRYTVDEIAAAVQPLHERIRELEAENERLGRSATPQIAAESGVP